MNIEWSTHMQLYSRILANLLVISNITSNFTGETDQIRLVGGAMGGPTPSTRASPRLCVAPRIPGVHQEHRRVGVCGETTMRPSWDLWETMRDFRREINGYPFTTFDIFRTFLGELGSRY